MTEIPGQMELPGLGIPASSDLTTNPSYEELAQQVAILEARNAGLRGLSTPGLVIEALEQIKATATSGVETAGQQLLFWNTVADWSTTVIADERAEWGDLL